MPGVGFEDSMHGIVVENRNDIDLGPRKWFIQLAAKEGGL
jgi:hypothetical protein